MASITYAANAYDVFIGIDVDQKSFSFTVKDHAMMNRAKKIPARPEYFYQYLQNHFAQRKVLCAYEAGPTGYHLYDYLKEHKQPCLVVSPFSIPKAPNQRVKNNRLDSQKITEELKAGNLRAIRVPEGEYRELRHLVTLRENYVGSRIKAKQRIKSLLLYVHLLPHLPEDTKSWTNRYIQALKQLSCTPAVRQQLDMLLLDLEYARKQTVTVLHSLRTFVRQHPAIGSSVSFLESLPGIGFITATTILGRIGDPRALKDVRELAGFVGLIPAEHSTGDVVTHGAITRLGNYNLRSLIIEAAWAAIRKDTQLYQFYHRIKARHHPILGARKAIVAVARKLTQRIYCVLKEQRMYQCR